MTVTKLYYVADPMCSWCWGFAPVLATLRTVLPPTLKVHYIMGGLAPDSNEPMPATVRSYVRNAWRQVEKQTGASFNWDYWEKCRPRRSTYPACRAVLAAAQQGAGEAMFNAIQQAYYLAAQNPSDLETLYHLAAQLDLDVKRFIPWSNVGFWIKAIFQSGTIAGNNADVIRLIWSSELWPSHVCSKTSTDFYAACIVNSKIPGSVSDREIDRLTCNYRFS